jgi:tellurite resistance protein
MFLTTLTDEQKKILLHLAHNVTVSDGESTTAEELMMLNMRKEMHLDDKFESHYIELEGIQNVFDTRKSRIIVIIALLRLSYADGVFDIEEQCLISDVCQLFSISGEELTLLGNWVRRLQSLEREALALM